MKGLLKVLLVALVVSIIIIAPIAVHAGEADIPRIFSTPEIAE
jgi:hypothetical protein